MDSCSNLKFINPSSGPNNCRLSQYLNLHLLHSSQILTYSCHVKSIISFSNSTETVLLVVLSYAHQYAFVFAWTFYHCVKGLTYRMGWKYQTKTQTHSVNGPLLLCEWQIVRNIKRLWAEFDTVRRPLLRLCVCVGGGWVGRGGVGA